MRKNLFFFCIVISAFVHVNAQQSLRDARKQSWQSLVYRIPADTAEKYIRNYSTSPDDWIDEPPFAVWNADSLKYDELPVGNYLIVSVREHELITEYYCQSRLQVRPLNNRYRVELEVKDGNGYYPATAKVYVNNKEIKYDAVKKSFTINDKKPDEAILKITVPGDTLFMELTAMENVSDSEWRQWWTNISYTKAGRIITWPLRSFKKIITQPSRYWFSKRQKASYINYGYSIFNKPKYSPGDTVKLKAYILNKRKKRYKKGLTIFLEYIASGRKVSKNIATVKPLTPGSYIHEFVIGDSLESDRSYALLFKTSKGTVMMRSGFRIEDYLLDEMASWSFRSEKENYYRQDTMRFYASAKDANGLPLMDGRVNFYLLTNKIDKIYGEREFVPDTLWQQEKVLEVGGETKFEIAPLSFPSTDLSIKAIAIFKNSNNETEEKDIDITFTEESRVVQAKQDGAYISAVYIESGKEKNAIGWLSLSDDKKPVQVNFPYREKIDPYVSRYEFYIQDSTGKIIAGDEWEPDRYIPDFGRIQQKDTTGFTLYNPYKILVHYAVFSGRKIISAGADSSGLISWKKILPKRKMYDVEWNYVWAGEEQKGNNRIVVLDKVLDTRISNAQTIYPGQTDTIKISVKDYKGNPAGNVNLSAVSYNSQFKDAIRVSEPPYLQKFKIKRRILFDDYEITESGFTRRLPLGDHQQWRSKLGLDTMVYYQLLFPKEDFTIVSRLISEFTPQLAVHVVKNGAPQEIYMLYINREFAWYNGVTDKSNYAFAVAPGFTQVGFRLKDKFIVIDSIYVQPFYKHDISFDLDRLPAKAIIEPRPEYFTAMERNQIENGIWQLQNDGRTNYGYIWQGNKVVHLGTNSVHRVGPFSPRDSLQFFKPAGFDFKFPFEPGFEYRLTRGMARLEKKNIFPAIEKIMLPKVTRTNWALGDTVIAVPQIKYPTAERKPWLKANDNSFLSDNKNGFGSLKIELPKDSVFIYGILYRQEKDTSITRIRHYDVGNFYSILPGRYNLVLVSSGFSFLVIEELIISPGGTLCIRFSKPLFESSNTFFYQLLKQDEERSKKEMEEYFKAEKEQLARIPGTVSQVLPLPKGNGTITGKVTDKKGRSPVPGATVKVKGYDSGISTSPDGSFRLSNIRKGNYVLMISSVGYETKEVKVEVIEAKVTEIDVQLLMGESNLQEVVVIGYGTRSRRNLTASISSVRGEELISSLQGKVAGLSLQGEPWANNPVHIRGINSFANNSKPVYVVNGVVMDELPAGFDMSGMDVNVLTGEAATGLYGARAAGGAVLITTADFIPKKVRDKFRDYAFWQPNLVTNENGEVRFTVTYPDNITGWQTYVIGMDKKRRFTKASVFTKSVKPLLGQLSTPQFLIEGDSSVFIGKAINYTNTDFFLTTDFRLADTTARAGNQQLKANSSLIETLDVFVNNDDTLAAQFTVATNTGYSDGEFKKIPVFKKGVVETKGSFWVLDKDTSFSFLPQKDAGDIILYAQNNTLDVLLDELNQLKAYPFFCMEQTASKLCGLVMEKKIRQELKQPFKEEKEIRRLLEKLQKSQCFDGGWSWWPGGNANLAVTNYIIQSLLPLRNETLVETSIRNGLLYLQNQLVFLDRAELLSALFTLSEAGHSMDYQNYLSKLSFDSLTIHQQWQVVKIKQNRGLNFETELNELMNRKIETMLGGLHWGEDSYYWDRNDMATTTLVFKVLEKEIKYRPFLKQMIQFFLERRENGKWRNTVESASTLAAILPTILRQNNNFTSSAQLNIKADKTISVEKFPFRQVLHNPQTTLDISRSGGGLVYFTAWQKIININPEPVTDNFVINTWFERHGTNISSLTAGEKTMMKVRVKVLADADYVQIEIPVPAGCTYAMKKQANEKMHIEYLKDKLVVFVEKMRKGEYNYEIELEPRYTGNYNLNPARAELMYFPTRNGRNNMKKVTIKK